MVENLQRSASFMSNRKQLLAAVRQGEYAHAGEEEAIELAMTLVSKRAEQLLLDVGSGLGGTARYLEQTGWGKVTGVDIDKKMIEYANAQYSSIKFYEGSADVLSTLFKSRDFDVVYSFNAFFCFREQARCLNEMAMVAKKDADLIIFEYTSPFTYSDKNPFFDPAGLSYSKIFSPINLETIEQTLFENHWQLKNIINLNQKYLLWYQWLIEKMDQQKSDLINKFGHSTFQGLYDGYCVLIDLITSKKLGGGIIHAKRH